jgi:hypothetical protein
MVMEDGKWTSYRLPKGSHSYDGAHGWNTEWPRIRDIGEAGSRLMTMHGLFWKFPANFSSKQSAGIAPRSAYLKVIGDFTPWQGRLVFGCDDTAKSEFLNKRPAKGALAGPGQSQSNLWFTSLDTPDKLGPAIGRGSVWVDEPVKAGEASDPFLLAGFAKRRGVRPARRGSAATTFTLEIDALGDGRWKHLARNRAEGRRSDAVGRDPRRRRRRLDPPPRPTATSPKRASPSNTPPRTSAATSATRSSKA